MPKTPEPESQKKLLIGPAGCGKTHRVFEEFHRALESQADPLAEDHFLILPSAEHTDRVITLLLQRGLRGFFHQRITTLARLIPRLFGVEEDRVISNTARYMLVRDLLTRERYGYFDLLQDRPGFVRLAAQFIMELKESLISCDSFRTQMNRLKTLEPELAPKYESLASLYESYEAELKTQGYRDRPDLLSVFRQRRDCGETKPRRIRHIWLDGFFDFSHLQLAYLEELCRYADEVTVTLTAENESKRPHLFEAVSGTRRSLESLGFKTEWVGGKNYRSRDAMLTHLEREIFKDRPAAVKAAGDSIRVFEAVGREGEVEMMAREIDRIYASGGYRYSDFAVLLRSVGEYDAVLQSVFERYGIPVEVHERERLEKSPWVHAVVRLLKIFRDDWKREDVLNFLKSSYVLRTGTGHVKTYEWLNRLEHCAFARGTRSGRGAWLEKWAGAEADDFEKSRQAALGELAAFEDRLRGAAGYAELRSIFMRGLSGLFGLTELGADADTASRRDNAGAGRLEGLLEEIRRALAAQGRSGLALEEFTERLLHLVELDLYSIHHRDKNRVQVYGVSLARQKEYRVVFVAGLLEKSFPMLMKEDPILSDWERRLFNGGSGFSLQERLKRQHLERYLFYLAVTRAREKLVLSYPRLDREGKESLPSFYADEAGLVFRSPLPKMSQDLSQPYPSFEQVRTAREFEIALMGKLWSRPPENEPFLEAALICLLQDPGAREKIQAAVRPVDAVLRDPLLAGERAFRAEVMSPTRLEEYAKCHYRYFANRILKLKDPDENVNIMRKGTILHQVLEHFFLEVRAGNRALTAGDALREFVLQEVDRGLKEHPLAGEKFYQLQLERLELEEMLLSFLDAEIRRLETSAFRPAYFEFGFGTGEKPDAPPLIFRAGEKETQLIGKIDRIDVDPDGRFGVVIDYKRTAAFKREDLELGTALQIPVYLEALEQFLKLEPAAGELYSIRARKKSGIYLKENAEGFPEFPARGYQLPEKDFRSVLARSKKYIERFIAELRERNIEVNPRHCESYCPYTAVCRIEKWRLAEILERIKEDDALREAGAAGSEKAPPKKRPGKKGAAV